MDTPENDGSERKPAEDPGSETEVEADMKMTPEGTSGERPAKARGVPFDGRGVPGFRGFVIRLMAGVEEIAHEINSDNGRHTPGALGVFLRVNHSVRDSEPVKRGRSVVDFVVGLPKPGFWSRVRYSMTPLKYMKAGRGK